MNTLRILLLVSIAFAAPGLAAQTWNQSYGAPAYARFNTSHDSPAGYASGQTARSAQSFFPGPGGGPTGSFRFSGDFGTGTNEITGTATFEKDGQGTELDFQDTLGLKEEDGSKYGALIQLGGLRLGFNSQEFNFEGQRTLSAADLVDGIIINGEEVVPPGSATASMDSSLESTYYRGDLGFTLPTFPIGPVSLEVGAGIVLHYYNLDLHAEAAADSDNDGTDDFFQTKDFDTPAGTPNVGIHACVGLFNVIAIEPQFLIPLPIEVISGVSVSSTEFNITAKWYIFPILAVGVRYSVYDASLEIDTDDADGDVDISSTQISGVVTLSF